MIRAQLHVQIYVYNVGIRGIPRAKLRARTVMNSYYYSTG